jgi:sugar transferase (PEP-CTERM/EpsH1 system associated)
VRILFLSPRQCLPLRSGAKLREYHFARALGRDFEVTYLYFAEPGSADLTRADLPFCREIMGVPRAAAYTVPQLLGGVAGKWPLPVINYTSALMRAAVRKVAAAGPFDLVHLDSIHMIRYLEELPPVRVVWNWHNIESEAMRRYAETVKSAPRQWYANRTAAKMQRLEQEMLRTGFGHIVCSVREKELLQKEAPGAPIEVIANGVDTNYFAGAAHSGEPRALVFVGTMDYYPNVEAAISFTARAWPAIRAVLPSARLVIAGANPTPAVKALGQQEGVTVTGTVPDVRPYYEDALAAIVPLRTGGGTRLKILEAMAAGVPVISTPLGAEGLDVTVNRDILLANADDPAVWARHVAALAASGDLRNRLAAAGRELVARQYDWDLLGRRLSATYQSWLREAR